MNEFVLWFSTGVQHIADLQAYDHILFVSLLALAYPLYEWKKLLILVTAFTVGHSLSLAVSVMEQVHLPVSAIEFLIALSILITGFFQLFYWKRTELSGGKSIYILVLIFGLIHGLGFSFLLRAMLGKGENVFWPLMYFNLGLELGQLIIVGIVLLFSLFLIYILKWPYRIYKLSILCLITLIALKLTIERLPLLFS